MTKVVTVTLVIIWYDTVYHNTILVTTQTQVVSHTVTILVNTQIQVV